MEDKVYYAEPIHVTEQQKKRFLPPEYRRLQEMTLEASEMSAAELFYRQAKQMENFEDEYEFQGDFRCYCPTYRDMDWAQLRGYFSWRTKLRRGIVEKTCLSFAFVYIYELLAGIGSETFEEGLDKLKAFYKEYGALDSGIKKYLKTWIRDYGVYYDLDPSLIGEFADWEFDHALELLQEAEECPDDKLFEAAVQVSGFRLERSRLYRMYPEQLKQTFCGVVRQMTAYYKIQGKRSYFEKLFGRGYSVYYHMFQSAVFFDRVERVNYEYWVSPMQVYRCRNGQWKCSRAYVAAGRNRELEKLLRAADSHLRDRLGVRAIRRPDGETKAMKALIEQVLDGIRNGKAEAGSGSVQPPGKIELSLSKLEEIRRAAEITCEKLMTEEEREGEAQAPEPDLNSSSGLAFPETEFLYRLLYGADAVGWLREQHLMLSVEVDRINEALYDLLGDTAIVFEGEVPTIVEDYRAELEETVRRRSGEE